MSAPVRTERIGDIAVWTIDRPATRNAVDPEVHDALASALDSLDQDGIRAVVLTGAGGTFISGGDLKLIRERPFDETLALSRRMTALLDRVERAPVPFLAAIEGYAMGGGCEVMLACDFRVAAPAAKVSFRQVAMGLSTGWGATVRLSQLVARGTATRLLMAGEVLPAAEAHALGLLDELADDPLARAVELAGLIADQSADAVAAFKRTIRLAYSADATTARNAEWVAFESLWGGPDHEAALEAFFRRKG